MSEWTGLTTGAITGVIDRLEKAGYVRRERDPRDRRRVIVRPLHETGHRIDRLFEPKSRMIHELCAQYDVRDLAVIFDSVSKTNRILSEATKGLAGGAGRREEPSKAGFADAAGDPPLPAGRSGEER